MAAARPAAGLLFCDLGGQLGCDLVLGLGVNFAVGAGGLDAAVPVAVAGDEQLPLPHGLPRCALGRAAVDLHLRDHPVAGGDEIRDLPLGDHAV